MQSLIQKGKHTDNWNPICSCLLLPPVLELTLQLPPTPLTLLEHCPANLQLETPPILGPGSLDLFIPGSLSLFLFGTIQKRTCVGIMANRQIWVTLGLCGLG